VEHFPLAAVKPDMKRIIGLLFFLLANTLCVQAAGLIIIHDADFWRRPWPPQPHPPPVIPPPRPVPPPVWAPLEVSFVKGDVRIQDQIATTVVEEEFYNPNPRQLEGTFLFPVPKGAHVSKFTMEINGKQVEAELLASDKARGIYEDIVRKLRDPALLEYSDRDLFKARIFPIEPNAKKRITLTWSQLLKSDAGLVNFVLPLNTEKFSARPLKNVSVKVDLETRRALKSIYSPSHKVEIKRPSPTKATVGYEASDLKPDTDFQLFFAHEEGDLGVNLLTYKKPGEDGYFALLASPGIDTRNVKIIPKDVAFVLDTSGSMAGAKLEQAKKALAFCVENLNDGDRFEILRFATEVEALFDRLTDATREHRAKAQSFIQELKPIGGTAIDDALKKALALRSEQGDRPFVVIFLTDGRPTVGVTDENQIVRNVTDSNKATTRIFCFGIGTDVNTHLLDRITEQTKAFSQYVLPEEDLEVKVSSFFTKIKEPVLANPKITFPDAVRVTKLYPSPLPDLFKGEQLVLVGRYSGKGDGAIQLEGSVSGETRKFAYDVKFPDEAADHEFIPRLWATRRVGYLLDEIRLRGESKELKDEVTELARKYGIVTPYTAYLILEDERQRGITMHRQTLRPWAEPEVREQLSLQYGRFSTERDGLAAVGGARSSYSLRAAESAQEAIVAGNVDAFRAVPPTTMAPALAMPPGSSPTPSRGALVTGLAGGYASGTVTNVAVAAAKQVSQQGRYVAGRTFYQNGEQWIDSEAQKFTNAAPVRVQFNTSEYFDLLKQHPEARPWLALGCNLQVVLGKALYEIYE
jgi:Ca-activated chloride channel family protein